MMYKAHIKRWLDCFLSALLLLILWPLLLLLIILIRLDSPGKAIFRQARAGRHRKSFYIYKFRTMHPDAPDNIAAESMAEPKRYITRIGRFLRKSGLDELPQLFNILRGDMSFVGPRPLILAETAIIEEREAGGIYELRPGLTGWAQVNGRDKVDGKTKVALDAEYAAKMSFCFDFLCCIKTVFVIFRAEGYREDNS